MIDKLGIIGVGLIGGSTGLSLKKKNLVKTVYGYDANKENLKKAKELEIIDKAVDLKTIASCEIIVIATPVETIADYVVKMCELSQGSVILDFGSVKKPIIDQVLNKSGNCSKYVPMHPIAGTENFGPEAAKNNLFNGAYCIITPHSKIDKDATEKAKNLVSLLGMKIKEMEPAFHDKVFGYVSHLPHVIAYTLVNLVFDKPEQYRFIGGGFKDYTRVAASSENMWSGIFLLNKDNVIEAIDDYIGQLEYVKEMIQDNNRKAINEYLRKARTFKRQLNE